MKEFWNNRFHNKDYIYGKQPNVFFKTELNKIKNSGKALFPLEGEGRNACYAANKGFKVDAFDFSDAGKLKAEKLCALYNTSINYTISKAEDFDFKKNEYDLIVLIYAHLAPKLRKAFHQNMANALKPGGKLILEAFHPTQLLNNYSSGGPKNVDMLYTLAAIKNDFSELSKTEGKELEICLDEGTYHKGKAFVTRFTGIK